MTIHSDTARFLQAVFPDYAAHGLLFANLNPPAHTRKPEALDGGRDCYFTAAGFAAGAATNTKADVTAVWALVVDDVGDAAKSHVSGLAVELALGLPTAVVETSAGNQQWSYRLSRPLGVAEWDAWRAGIEARVAAPVKLDNASAQCLFRLPMGVNSKMGRFHVKLVEVNPGVVLDVDSIVPVSVGPGPSVAHGGGGFVDDIRGLLDLIPNGDRDYDGWMAVLHRAKAAARDEEAAREAAEEWSAKSLKHDPGEFAHRWGTVDPSRTSGRELLLEAEAASPEGFRAWQAAEAGGAFDDDADPTAALAAAAAGAAGLVDFVPDHQKSARRVLAVLGGTVRQIGDDDWRQFDPVVGRWRKWPGAHMLRVVEQLAEARRMGGGPLKKGMEKKLGSRAFLGSVASLAAVNAEVIAQVMDFDNDPLLLGTPSGVIELGAGKARAVRPGLAGEMVSKSTAVDPAPVGTATPLWSAFLGEFTGGDAALEEWLQVYAGYSLTGLSREHLMPFFHGASGGNGKSTYINTLLGVWGEYGTGIPKALLFEKPSSGGHTANLAAMEGKRLGALTDVDPKMMWDMQTLKQLTGGDIVKADHKYGAPFDFRAMVKMVVSGQSIPGVRVMDGGMERRLKIVTLNTKPRAINLDLGLDLMGEWEGVLRWALDGLDLYWGMGGLPVVRTIADATKEFIEEQDVFGRWVRETWVRDAKAGDLTMDDLFRSWDAFRSKEGAHGIPPVNNVHLGRRLREVGVNTHKTTKGAVVRGYKIMAESPF